MFLTNLTAPFLLLLLLGVGCSPTKDSVDEGARDFMGHDKWFGHLADTLQGDHLTYTGQQTVRSATGVPTSDSGVFIELVMDSDHRFAIRTRSTGRTIKTDTATIIQVAHQSNKGIGTWSDVGEWLELEFQIGTVDSYFDPRNEGARFKTIDRVTLRISKTVDTLWIWRTKCVRR